MRIVQITPGSGEAFYCENCLRDYAMVRAMRLAGHDVTLVPLYLPPLAGHVDEPATAPIFFGGVNVYLQQKLAVFRRTPRWLDRLLDAPALLRRAGKMAGMTSAADLAATTLSMLRGEDGRQKKELIRLVDWMARRDRPDVVSLSNSLLAGLARRIKKTLGAPIVCWLQDEDEFLDALPEDLPKQAWDAIAACAENIDAFIASSGYYRQAMIRRLGLDPAKVHVAYNSMDWSRYEPSAPRGRVIGFLSRMCRGKGLDIIAEAFIRLRGRPEFGDVRLAAAGGRTAGDRAYIQGVTARLAAAGLRDSVRILPNPPGDERLEFLRSLSVLSVPERGGEAAGLYVLEAQACGVPVVQPDNGAFPELLGMTHGGWLFPAGDAAALAEQLGKLLSDEPLRRQLGRAGRDAVLTEFALPKTAGQVLAIYKSVYGSWGVAPPT